MFDMSKRLREIRFMLGKTQREMASALDMPTRSWQNYEYGTAGQFSAADLYKLCEIFHLSADFFFCRTDDMHASLDDKANSSKAQASLAAQLADAHAETKDMLTAMKKKMAERDRVIRKFLVKTLHKDLGTGSSNQ